LRKGRPDQCPVEHPVKQIPRKRVSPRPKRVRVEVHEALAVGVRPRIRCNRQDLPTLAAMEQHAVRAELLQDLAETLECSHLPGHRQRKAGAVGQTDQSDAVDGLVLTRRMLQHPCVLPGIDRFYGGHDQHRMPIIPVLSSEEVFLVGESVREYAWANVGDAHG
jgi:hypothetical protein